MFPSLLFTKFCPIKIKSFRILITQYVLVLCVFIEIRTTVNEVTPSRNLSVRSTDVRIYEYMYVCMYEKSDNQVMLIKDTSSHKYSLPTLNCTKIFLGNHQCHDRVIYRRFGDVTCFHPISYLRSFSHTF
jgi:hypothetical protein